MLAAKKSKTCEAPNSLKRPKAALEKITLGVNASVVLRGYLVGFCGQICFLVCWGECLWAAGPHTGGQHHKTRNMEGGM